MNPEVVIIVEDNAGRIENTLRALVLAKDIGAISNDAQAILKNTEMLKADGSLLCHDFPSIIDSREHVKVICPQSGYVTTFARITEVLNTCQTLPAICFLDMQLENSALNKLSKLKPLELGAGIRIGEMFRSGFGRLLVQASNTAGGRGYSKSFDSNYFVSGFPAISLPGAKLLVKEALNEYRKRYCLHAVPEVASFLWLLWRSIKENWDPPYEPFFHDALQKKDDMPTRHLSELVSYLELPPETLMDDSGNSAKELFEIVRTSEGELMTDGGDHRNVSNEVLKAVLKKLGIVATLELTGINNKGWRFPRKPALPFLLALRSFLEATKERGPVPKVRLAGHRDEQFTGIMTFTFEQQDNGEPCTLVSSYAAKSSKNTSRPNAGLSADFYDLIRAKVKFEEKIENVIADSDLSVYSCEITPIEYEPCEKDANEISVKWRI